MQRNILIMIVVLSVAFGASAVAAADHGTIDVDQEPGAPATVTVTDADDEPVENGSVTVELADENQSDYEGTENFTTDANGTVQLPAPEETVDIAVTATVDNESVSTETTLEAAPELAIDIEQEIGHSATVAVAADDEPIENQTVAVETVEENATYDGVGEYTTDEDGRVELPTPNETVDVTVSTEYQGASASATETLEAPPELDVSVDQDGPGLPAIATVAADDEPTANVSIDVGLADGENSSYTGAGGYETDENGSIELPAPEETVEVTVTATHQGATETLLTTLEGVDAIDDDLPFGQQLQQFKASLDDDAHRGSEVASWATDNNPGNAPDHAGPKDSIGGESATTERENSGGNPGNGSAGGNGNNADSEGNGTPGNNGTPSGDGKR